MLDLLLLEKEKTPTLTGPPAPPPPAFEYSRWIRSKVDYHHQNLVQLFLLQNLHSA
jgi:hypothetical protein